MLVTSLVLLAGPRSVGSADEASGTWTGVAEMRGNYYWEQSTRVVAPTIAVDVESPEGARLHADYLVDSITSASVAAGTRADVAFTEVRHEVGLGAGYELEIDGNPFELTGRFRVSREPDYRSLGAGLAGALSLADRATVLRLSTFFVRDRIEQLIRGAGGVAGNLSDRGVVGHLNSTVTSFVWEQVLTPVLTAQVGYDFGYLTGYLQNPYRLVAIRSELAPENHPDERFRHTLTGRLAYHVRSTGTSLHATYRTYLDSWDVAALTPEVRIYQEIGAFTLLRARYRFYTQTRAFFTRPTGDYTAEDTFVTNDPKMTEFRSHLMGFQLLQELTFLRDSFLHFARNATIDMSFDYLWRTNRWGNGVIAQLGLRLPF